MSESPKLTEYQKWKSEFPVVLRRTVIGGAIALGLSTAAVVTSGVWEKSVSFINSVGQIGTQITLLTEDIAQKDEQTQEKLALLQASVQENARAIQQLRLPTDLFDLSPLSGPVQGFCTGGEECGYRIRVRRSADAISCQITDGTEWFYRNPRDSEVHNVSILSGERGNIGISWVNFTVVMTTPFGLAPDAELCVRPEYIGCPGQLEGEPYSPEVECISVEIKG